MENKQKERMLITIFYALYVIWTLFITWHFSGQYAIDEFFHLSATDRIFFETTVYDRAPYLNGVIRFFANVFGRGLVGYKLIPCILGMISTSIYFFLFYRSMKHVYSLCCFMFVMATHSLLIANHVYIRMYVFDECVVALLCLILYVISRTNKLWKKILLNALYFICSIILFLFQTTEQSSVAIAVVGIAAWIVFMVGPRILENLKAKRLIIPAIAVVVVIIMSVIIYMGLIRYSIISCPSFLEGFLMKQEEGVQFPIFRDYFLTRGAFLSLGLIGFGYYLIKRPKNYLLGIYACGILPFIAYQAVYFDQLVFRTFVPYMPAMIFGLLLWIDNCINKKIFYASITSISIITVLFSYPGNYSYQGFDINIKNYYERLYTDDLEFADYGMLLQEIEAELTDGKKCMAMWSNSHVNAALNYLPWDRTMYLQGDLSEYFDYSDRDFEDVLVFLEQQKEPYIFVIGPRCEGKINRWYNTTFMEKLKKRYQYEFYPQAMDAYIFFINE